MVCLIPPLDYGVKMMGLYSIVVMGMRTIKIECAKFISMNVKLFLC